MGHAARNESGQSVVEFGMVVPLLCVLVLVFVDFGKAMNYWLDLTHVANQIARQAAVNSTTLRSTDEQCAQLETNELRDGSSSVDPATIKFRFPENSRAAGKSVEVEVATNYHWIPFMGGSWAVKGKATMRLEHELDPGFTNGSC